MSDYSNLRRRLEDREVIILDGAIGTQLQSMGVPMDNDTLGKVSFCGIIIGQVCQSGRRESRTGGFVNAPGLVAAVVGKTERLFK